MEESIIYVDADAGDGEETGESWADAYTDLQDAADDGGAISIESGSDLAVDSVVFTNANKTN